MATCVTLSTYHHRLDQCLELLIRTNRLPEAAFLARTYLPSQVSRVVKLWRENLAKVNQKVSNQDYCLLETTSIKLGGENTI